MNNTPAMTAIVIQPWQAGLYNALQQRATLASVARSLEHFDGHRRALEAKGDLAAVAGTTTPTRQAVLKLAGVAATSSTMLARKIKLILTHRRTWADHPMAALLIEAAIVSDVAALKLGKDEEQRLLQRLRGGK